jgi:cytochrome c peroxidase
MPWALLQGSFAAILLVAWAGNAVALDATEPHYELKLLGKYVFFDKISNPPRMACVTCHDPATGGTGSVSGVNLHQVGITGANPHRVGTLKPPNNAYASVIVWEGAVAKQIGVSPFHDNTEGCALGAALAGKRWCGGNFWNGRAEGRPTGNQPLFPPALTPTANGPLFPTATPHIGVEVFKGNSALQPYAVYFGPTSDQALNPMPNPVEQNIDRQAVCRHVASAKYAELYEKVWWEPIDCSDTVVPDLTEKQFDISFKRLMLAVGAWQSSGDLNSFSSKRDIALRNDADGKFPLAGLTQQENWGHDLFYGIQSASNSSGRNARCFTCHNDRPSLDTGEERFQLYADDAYHNIGTPRNPEIRDGDPDQGLAGHIDNVGRRGFFRTPTVRNVDKRKGNGFTKAYTHNGWFKSLESIVHFYNTAFIPTAPSAPDNLTTAERFGIFRCSPDRDWTEREALAANCWPAPPENTAGIAIRSFASAEARGRNFAAMGDLRLTAEEEAAVVAYLKTLTDTWTPVEPPPYQPAKPDKKVKK